MNCRLTVEFTTFQFAKNNSSTDRLRTKTINTCLKTRTVKTNQDRFRDLPQIGKGLVSLNGNLSMSHAEGSSTKNSLSRREDFHVKLFFFYIRGLAVDWKLL